MVHILLTTISNALWWTNIVAFWWKIQRCLFFQRGLLTTTKYPITAYSAIGSVIPYQLAISSHSHVDLLYDRLTILVRGPHSRSVLGQKFHHHYDDVIMTMLASQITSLPVVCSIVYSDVNQRKHQSSASLAFVREIHRGPVNFPHKWPVTRKMFPFDDVIMTSVGHTMNNVAVFTTHKLYFANGLYAFNAIVPHTHNCRTWHVQAITTLSYRHINNVATHSIVTFISMFNKRYEKRLLWNAIGRSESQDRADPMAIRLFLDSGPGVKELVNIHVWRKCLVNK